MGKTTKRPGGLYAEVDKSGRLVLPPEIASRYGMKRGDRIFLGEATNGLYVPRSATQLAKLYIEPTNLCNLNCRTCVRNVWNEPMGYMSDATFDRVISGLGGFSPPPSVFFGGLGEPLLHPKIIEMVTRAKALGAPVELITNGTLLTQGLLERLVAIGLDTLWVSIDGARPESYADIRLGDMLPGVLETLGHFRHIQFRQASPFSGVPQTQLGIVFVAMKRNIADLPEVCDIAWKLGAKRFLVTNVLPYTAELCDEVLYSYKIGEIYEFSQKHSGVIQSFLPPHIHLPRIDIDEVTDNPIRSAISRGVTATWTDSMFLGAKNHCPFIESGAGVIRWDGSLSPCLPLLHNHTSFLDTRVRSQRAWAIGSLAEHDLSRLWNTPEHIAFRERVQAFDFPPCLICGGCDLLDENEDDCFSSGFPACGACLWAQGLIQCP
ncbi:MAG: radical SAM protein [Chloroflexi bacterium]|nr:MAG: radical SAM protein [Chloroflexota bacterium]